MAINLYFAQKREGTMHCGGPEVLGLAAQWSFWAVLAFWRRRRCYLLATATVLGLLETLFELYNRREPRDVAMTMTVLMALRGCKTVTQVAC